MLEITQPPEVASAASSRHRHSPAAQPSDSRIPRAVASACMLGFVWAEVPTARPLHRNTCRIRSQVQNRSGIGAAASGRPVAASGHRSVVVVQLSASVLESEAAWLEKAAAKQYTTPGSIPVGHSRLTVT